MMDNGSINTLLQKMYNDDLLATGWRWSRSSETRAKSENWNMTLENNNKMEIKPAHALRGQQMPVYVRIGSQPYIKLIVLTYHDSIERELDELFYSKNDKT